MDSSTEGYLWKLLVNSNFDDKIREYLTLKINNIETNEEAYQYIKYLKLNQLPDLNEQYDMLIEREDRRDEIIKQID